MVTRLHLSHAIVVRLHVRKGNVFLSSHRKSWVHLSNNPSLFSIQDEAMDVARATGTQFHGDVIGSLPWSRELMVLRVRNVHQLGSRPTFFIPCWTTHPCILYYRCGIACCWCCCYYLGIAQMLSCPRKDLDYFNFFCEEAALSARKSSKIPCT